MTDTPLHGNQEDRFFPGYYGHYRCLPLYTFCGHRLLCTMLRPAGIGDPVGLVDLLESLLEPLRRR